MLSNFDLSKNPHPNSITAKRVVYNKGDHFHYKNNSTEKLSSLPFPTRKAPPELEVFVGMKKGSLTVLGMYNGIEVGAKRCGRGGRSKPSGHGWVCRCSCGNYTIRKTKSLRKKSWDACVECTANKNRRDGIK